jgi:hypothetical protein
MSVDEDILRRACDKTAFGQDVYRITVEGTSSTYEQRLDMTSHCFVAIRFRIYNPNKKLQTFKLYFSLWSQNFKFWLNESDPWLATLLKFVRYLELRLFRSNGRGINLETHYHVVLKLTLRGPQLSCHIRLHSVVWKETKFLLFPFTTCTLISSREVPALRLARGLAIMFEESCFSQSLQIKTGTVS